MTPLDMYGRKLVPGVNVDHVDLAAGAAMAQKLGYYDHGTDRILVDYALKCWKRGEEDIAEKVWIHEYPNDLTSWKMILAAAVAVGTRLAKEASDES